MINKLLDMFRKRKPGELSGQETEFLPAVLEVTETPPSPVGRLVLWTIIILLVVGLGWTIFGHIDEVAVANGKIIPVGQVKVLQSEDKGVVKAIYVKEGQEVKKGELLMELDQTMSAADVARLRKQVAYYTVEIDRLLAERTGQAFAPQPSPDLDPKDLEAQLSLYRSRLAEYETKKANAEAGVRQNLAAQDSAAANREKFAKLLVIAREREERMAGLVEENAVALFQFMDYQSKRMELEQNLAAQEAEIARTDAALAASQEALSNVTAAWNKDIDTKLTDDRKELAAYSEELKKADEKNRLAKIISPVDGRVNQLQVHTLGGVVKEVQSLMMIVPYDVTLEVEAWAANKDIGFLQVGQKAEVKVETFNFQKFGTIDAEVAEISPDAVEDSQDKDKTMKYRVMLKLDKNDMLVNDRKVPLSPGMSAVAEIKIRRKRIIEYFLDPFRQYQSEALRER
ncbi:MAG TPA: HlyD family type I secretion periplasmic adaptor subunit [Methylomusa anaerophila]|uniref:Hemolysin secretion protein D, chromosomal n=1 Tax=Methylomusa anaerophila TaxID=1930071 RepID=A0A348AKQ3_9FIRM|nr:HlyD family type I secretion periplasmic adaptor subunit [Methylomusa anaerophila]BBB91651.1 hemolysin secretion protein D, chromosomal [Methylomusa anaerophila]HML88615.1 HlyD family type I secretion periplasmic adaptor subunit [Methylomusa anaerophila]